MSLSRVIKSGNRGGESMSSFRFDSFQTNTKRSSRARADGFSPFFLVDDAPPAAAETEVYSGDAQPAEVLNPANGMIMISEEELAERLEESFAKGAEEERRHADDDLGGICSALVEAISLISRLRERIIKESEEELLQLSFLVAKKIIRQEIKQDRQIMAQVVNEALREFPEQHDITICLHPDDYRVISSNRELFLAAVGDEKQISLKADEAMTLGGCVVESSTGVIDARIEAQLEEIYRSLLEERNVLCDLPDGTGQV